MPSDLELTQPARPIQVRDRGGTGLPFSKGIMATSILATGLKTDRAYAIAAEVEQALRSTDSTEIDVDELSTLAETTIHNRAGSEMAGRYRAWRRAKRSGRPVIVVLGGASGVGKSTIATRLAVRLGITRVMTTDTIREVLRTVIPESVLPELHVSTFERIRDLGGEGSSDAYHRQARSVGAATAAVASRLASEKRSAVVEGAHVLPGQIRDALTDHESRPIVVEFTLVLEDEEQYRARLMHRRNHEPARAGQRQLDNLDSIQEVQRLLVRQARKARVRTFDVTHPEQLTQQIVDEVALQLDLGPALVEGR